MKLFLAPAVPVFKARVDGPDAFAFPMRDIEYDTVTLGTYSDIWPNQTVFLGSTEGASDLGVTRVRALADSNTLPIGLSSRGVRYGEIDPVDNCYITVLSDWRVWPKIPRIDSDGTRYMDGAMDWATYGQYSPPVAIAGAAVIATIDPITEVITVDFDAGDSYTTHPSATIAAYGWAVGDGTITAGTTSTAAITATFPAGFRWVTVAVADSNSQFHYKHIPVLAIDPDADPCISNFTIERHTIRPDGQEMTVRIREDIPTSTIPDNTLALVFEGEPTAPDDRSNLVLMGWLEDEPAELEGTETGTLKDIVLNIADVAGRLKSLPGFPQIIEHNASPDQWGEMDTPDMNRYIHFLLQWQTTALDLADYTPATDGDSYTFKVLGSDGASLFEQVNRRAQALIPDHLLTCDTKGALRVLPDPLLQDAADRTNTVQVTLDAGDYSNLTYAQQRHPRVHWLRSNAILADTTAINTAFCIAPGSSPGWGESAQDDGEHLALSQSDLNIVTGHRYARLNAPQGLFRLTLAEGSRQGIEPALMTWVRLTIPATAAAQRGLSFTNERGLVQQIDVRYASTRTGLIKTYTLTWERETSGTPAVTVVVETAEPVNPTDPLVPPVVTLPPSFDGGVTAGSDIIALIGDGGEIFKTANFTANPPTWTTVTSHTSGFGGSVTVHSFVVDPFSPLYRTGTGAVNGFLATGGGIWKISDIFDTPSVTNLHSFAHSISFSGGRWRSIAASFGRYQAVESDNPWIMVSTNYGNNTSGMQGTNIIYSVDGGQTWSSEIEVTGNGWRETGIGTGQQLRPGLWLSPRTPGYGITYAKTATGGQVPGAAWATYDWGATWSLAGVANPQYGLGGSLHVPWPNNTNEQVMYHGSLFQDSTFYDYSLYRQDSTTGATNITPVVGGHNYGPRGGLFGVRTYDNDRRYVVGVLFRNGVDDAETSDYVGVFYSTDYGNTWSQIVADVACTANQLWPLEAAFASDDPNYVMIFGNEAYIYTWENGTLYNKRGSLAPSGLERIVGLVGGD